MASNNSLPSEDLKRSKSSLADLGQKGINGTKALFKYASSFISENCGNAFQSMHEVKQKSANFPSGALAVCVKQVHVFSLDTKRLFARDDITVYVRILLGDQVKYTHAYDHAIVPFCLMFDSVRHFIIQPGESLGDVLSFELIAINPDKPLLHKILCKSHIDVFDIVGCTVDNRTMQMKGGEETSHIIAEMEVEFCFSYGLHGYGFSNQLLHGGKTPQEQLTHSLFFRSEPPIERADILNDVLQCQHIGHPMFISFQQKTEISSTANAFGSDLKFHNVTECTEPTLVVSQIGESLHKKQTQYRKLNSSKERIAFLKQLVSNKDQHRHVDDHHYLLNQGFHLKTKLLKEDEISSNKKTVVDETEKPILFKNMRRRLSSLTGYNFMPTKVIPHTSKLAGISPSEISMAKEESEKSKHSTSRENLHTSSHFQQQHNTKKGVTTVKHLDVSGTRISAVQDAGIRIKHMLGMEHQPMLRNKSVMVVDMDGQSDTDEESD